MNVHEDGIFLVCLHQIYFNFLLFFVSLCSSDQLMGFLMKYSIDKYEYHIWVYIENGYKVKVISIYVYIYRNRNRMKSEYILILSNIQVI